MNTESKNGFQQDPYWDRLRVMQMFAQLHENPGNALWDIVRVCLDKCAESKNSGVTGVNGSGDPCRFFLGKWSAVR